MAANDIFETWLNDKLCKFLNNNNNTDSNDTNIFLNYIISLLNEEEDTSLNDKKSSIESILHDLNPVWCFPNTKFLNLIDCLTFCFNSRINLIMRLNY